MAYSESISTGQVKDKGKAEVKKDIRKRTK